MSHFRSIQDRHLHIKESKVGRSLSHEIQPFSAIGRFPNLMPGRLKNCRQKISYIRIVVDNEHVSHIAIWDPQERILVTALYSNGNFDSEVLVTCCYLYDLRYALPQAVHSHARIRFFYRPGATPPG